MIEPPKNSSHDDLYPPFRADFERWLAQAQATFPQFHIKASETRRTLKRQQWLFSRGRTAKIDAQGNPIPMVTYTLLSKHRWGMAADLVVTRKTSPKDAIWDWRVFQAIYKAVPPAKYGLRVLDFELVHLEMMNADQVIARGGSGIHHT